MSTNKKLSIKEVLAFIIGSLLLITFISYLLIKDPEYSDIAWVIIAGFALAVLSFLIIGKVTGDGDIFGFNIKSASGGFVVFIIVLLTFFFYLKYYGEKKIDSEKKIDENTILFRNPQDTAVWNNAKGTFKWFNAPYGFAANKEHALTKYTWFKDNSFRLELLLFHSYDSLENNRSFNQKFRNLRLFLMHMQEFIDKDHSMINLQDKVQVRISKCKSIPTTSFFTTDKSNQNKPYSIIYFSIMDIYRPTSCFTTFSSEIYKELTKDFNKYFESNYIELSVDKLTSSANSLDNYNILDYCE